jgi:hypothetical protein
MHFVGISLYRAYYDSRATLEPCLLLHLSLKSHSQVLEAGDGTGGGATGGNAGQGGSIGGSSGGMSPFSTNLNFNSNINIGC